ncbi:glutathione S-transferase T3 [Brachypodium distachyon]|uniref:glutathione S-transferase T3 n=1 Tax=Brachypodium distachyon TaxID=15368 RepID=UPI0001C72AC9|nr:glutathione S-transferase T3 [Brachypodium distachyon]|eukprot:XP_010233472.1 glutathione S-transferase T3 [Brachypodium distachyon]
MYYPYSGPGSYPSFSHGVIGGAPMSQPSSSFAGFAGVDPRSVNNLQASPAGNNHEEVNVQESSGSSPGEQEEQVTKRRNWTEQENLRLVSAWLATSFDPIEGNSKKLEHYWKQVAEEYKSNTPQDRKRSSKQLRDHWSKANQLVTLFNGCYATQKSVYASGINDKGLMDQAKAVFKSKNKQKPFNLEYWWEAVRQHQKWRSIYMEKDCSSKRAKISEAGTYTSSSKETEETMEPQPEGQKQAK